MIRAGAGRRGETPAAVIVPPAASWTLQVTPVLAAFRTVAANATVLQASTAAGEGLIETVTGSGAAVTVTVAVSLLVGSARLVATTVQVLRSRGRCRRRLD